MVKFRDISTTCWSFSLLNDDFDFKTSCSDQNMLEYCYSSKWRRESINKTVSYDSLAHTLHSQDPSGKTVRHFWHTLWLHILHWLEKTFSRLRGSRHRPQLRSLYLPLPRLAPFLLMSSKSVFSFLRQKEMTWTSCKCKC